MRPALLPWRLLRGEDSRMAVHLMYETHSTTTDNENGIATGWLPGELSAAGRAQAAKLGCRRQGADARVVYVSDLHRARETADIAFSRTEIPIIPDWRLRECNYGAWNGMPVERLRAERSKRIDVPFPGGESYRQVVTRTIAFLSDLVDERDGETVIVIAHSANRWALDHLVHGTPLDALVDADFGWRPGWEYVVTPETVLGRV